MSKSSSKYKWSAESRETYWKNAARRCGLETEGTYWKDLRNVAKVLSQNHPELNLPPNPPLQREVHHKRREGESNTELRIICLRERSNWGRQVAVTYRTIFAEDLKKVCKRPRSNAEWKDLAEGLTNGIRTGTSNYFQSTAESKTNMNTKRTDYISIVAKLLNIEGYLTESKVKFPDYRFKDFEKKFKNARSKPKDRKSFVSNKRKSRLRSWEQDVWEAYRKYSAEESSSRAQRIASYADEVSGMGYTEPRTALYVETHLTDVTLENESVSSDMVGLFGEMPIDDSDEEELRDIFKESWQKDFGWI